MVEVDPWLIVLGEPATSHMAMWQLSTGGQVSMAIFSSQQRAEIYAQEFCEQPHRIVRFGQRPLIQLFAEAYQQGTRYAALDPNGSSARQMFVLRDVLAAARELLKKSRNLSAH